ncbi:MAG: type II toxin-antitoxin system VapC family toxin [Fimbriimonas sp.]
MDSHIILWAMHEPTRLSENQARLLSTPTVQPIVSVFSLWELTYKSRQAKLSVPFRVDFSIEQFLREFEGDWLPFLPSHAARVADLGLHHRDPFDLMILSQAISENLPVMTSDQKFALYPVRVLN